jgi:hypothetical protein
VLGRGYGELFRLRAAGSGYKRLKTRFRDMCFAGVPRRRSAVFHPGIMLGFPARLEWLHARLAVLPLAHEHLRRAHVQSTPLFALHKRQRELHRPVDVVEPESWPRVPEFERAVFPV